MGKPLDQDTLRRTYAKGMYDGLAKAGIDNPGEYMNNVKLQALREGQSSIAQKVLEFVPEGEPAQPHYIVQAMKKRTGTAPDLNILMGCLRALNEAGLVKEPTRGCYVRVCAKSFSLPPQKKLEKPVPDMPTIPNRQSPPSPLERLAALSTKLRGISKSADTLAAEIEDVAVEVTDHISKVEAGSGKLRQLQELLKSMT